MPDQGNGAIKTLSQVPDKRDQFRPREYLCTLKYCF